MSDSDEEEKKLRRLLALLGVLVFLVVGGILALALWQAHKGGHLGFGQPDTQTPERAVMESGQISIVPHNSDYAVLENGVAKFYFASGSVNLAANAPEVLTVVAEGVKQGRQAVISGYHDQTGSIEVNADIAKNRALAVQNALLALNVPAERIVLRKPEASQGSGSNAEARRVEVILE